MSALQKLLIVGFAFFWLVSTSALSAQTDTDADGKAESSHPEGSEDKQEQPEQRIDLQLILDVLKAAEPNIVPIAADWQRPEKYWQPHYHPQVTAEIFNLINYPFFPGGADYPQKDFSRISALFREPSASEVSETDTDKQSPPDESAAPDSDDHRKTDVEPAPPSPNASKGYLISYDRIDSIRYKLEKCFSVIHKWRSTNESNDMLLEIVRSCELTRTTTDIYRLNPELAVQVKRIIGQIGRINRNFDLTSRLTLHVILTGEGGEKVLLSRMDKQLADLESLLGHLHEYNDQIGIAIGLGRLNRQISRDDTINYSNLQLSKSQPSLSSTNPVSNR